MSYQQKLRHGGHVLASYAGYIAIYLDLALPFLQPIHKENNTFHYYTQTKGEPLLLNKETLKLTGSLDHINNIGDSYHK
jgi:hypothetical protein